MEKDKCPICLEKKKLVSVSDGCSHMCCPSCIKNVFKFQLTNRMHEVKCPICRGQIKTAEKIFGKKLYQQYLAVRELYQKYVTVRELPQRIQCPDIGCNGYIEPLQNTYICQECNKKICKWCLEYHNNQVCRDNETLAKENAKNKIRCPLCKVYIERYDRCLASSDMICPNCSIVLNINRVRYGNFREINNIDLYFLRHRTLHSILCKISWVILISLVYIIYSVINAIEQ